MERSEPLTKDGYTRLERELADLRSSGRKEVADRIHAAKELATTQNDSEYEDAKNQQAFIEGRILELERILQNAVIIDEDQAHHSNRVQLGSTVTVHHEDDGREQTFIVVGPTEANPHEGRISNESPVGRALIGKRAGENVEVSAPAGLQKLKITRVK